MKKSPGLVFGTPEISAKTVFSLNLPTRHSYLGNMRATAKSLKKQSFKKKRISLFSLTSLAALGLMAACTHLTPPSLSGSRPLPCSHMDWYEVGRLDGLSGAKPSKIEEHKLVCSGELSDLNEDMYMNGRDAGLVEYCSPQSGLEAGRKGDAYKNVCPTHLEPQFLTSYRVGQKIRELEIENENLEARIRSLSRLLSQNSSSQAIRAQIEQLRNRRTQNIIRISDLENQAGVSSQL